MSSERKCVYGIIQKPESTTFAVSGVEGCEVYAVTHQGLAAVVSDTGLEELDPTRKNVRAHTLVQEELLKTYTLLPMGFGMIANSEEDVVKLLKKNYQGLTDELMRLAGKVEAELKVYWDQEAMIGELRGRSEEFVRLEAKIKAAPSPVETQRLLMEAGQLVERVVLNWKAKYADRVYTSLKASSVDARLNSPLGVKNILNASFLIEKAREGAFRDQVYRLDSEYQGKVNLKYVGPLPPYSFVTLKLEPAS